MRVLSPFSPPPRGPASSSKIPCNRTCLCNDLTHAHIVHSPFCKVLAEKMLERLIGLLDDAGDERVSRKTFLETLAKGGLLPDDPRLAEMFKQLEIYGARADVKSEPSDGGTDDASRGILISDLVSVHSLFPLRFFNLFPLRFVLPRSVYLSARKTLATITQSIPRYSQVAPVRLCLLNSSFVW